MLAPFVLRRLKAGVLKQLVAKTEQLEMVALSKVGIFCVHTCVSCTMYLCKSYALYRRGQTWGLLRCCLCLELHLHPAFSYGIQRNVSLLPAGGIQIVYPFRTPGPYPVVLHLRLSQ